MNSDIRDALKSLNVGEELEIELGDLLATFGAENSPKTEEILAYQELLD